MWSPNLCSDVGQGHPLLPYSPQRLLWEQHTWEDTWLHQPLTTVFFHPQPGLRRAGNLVRRMMNLQHQERRGHCPELSTLDGGTGASHGKGLSILLHHQCHWWQMVTAGWPQGQWALEEVQGSSCEPPGVRAGISKRLLGLASASLSLSRWAPPGLTKERQSPPSSGHLPARVEDATHSLGKTASL